MPVTTYPESLFWPEYCGTGSEYGPGQVYSADSSGFVSRAWPSANRAYFVPVTLPVEMIARRLFVVNGAAVAGNVDVGIYDEAGNLEVSIGSTAQAGTNGLQYFDITDTRIEAGLHYLACAKNDTTGTTIATASNLSNLQAMGHASMDTAFALPSTATFALLASAYVPVIGFSTRAGV